MKKHVVGLLVVSTLAFTGCSLSPNPTTSEPVIDPNNLQPGQPDEGTGYSKKKSFDFNIQDVNKSNRMHNLSSNGTSKLLIVPVQLEGEKSWSTKMLDNLNNAFFGNSSNTGWESVSSFYKKSSYGKLDIIGEVAPVFQSSYSKSELASIDMQGSSHRPDVKVINEFDNDSSYYSLRKQYDADENGFVDSVAFIYSSLIDSDNGYWAWVYWHSYEANSSRPNVNSYMWASYDFIIQNSESDRIYAGYGNKVDAHTIIHESGHLLGLDDYYNYDGSWDPSGQLEMHSNNVGDENIYSKFALGWVEPYYVKSEEEITLTLRSSAYYGDAIILNDGWNGTSMDEYIMIEYYSPHMLNEKDSSAAYPANGKRMYTRSGFRIYHIDSRIVELNTRQQMVDFSDTMEAGKKYTIGPANSASRSYLKENKDDFKQVHLLEAGGTNTFKNQNRSASNATLFTKGDTFLAKKEFFYNASSFNDGSSVGYKVIVGECSQYQGTITIRRRTA